ncbi:thioester domain-containing protein [Arcanobacterium canis]
MDISKIKRGALASGLAGALLATAFGGVAQAQEQEHSQQLPRMAYTLRSEAYKNSSDGVVSPYIFTIPKTAQAKTYILQGSPEPMYREIPKNGRPEVIDEEKKQEDPSKNASLFETSKISASDVKEQFSHLTYCFDKTQSFPNNAGRNKISLETDEIAFTTPQTNTTNKQNQYYEPQSVQKELKDKHAVTQVIWNGFPTDTSNLRETLTLSIDEFHEATQQAVWKYTDKNTWSLERARQNLGTQEGLRSYVAYLVLAGEKPRSNEAEAQTLLTRRPN